MAIRESRAARLRSRPYSPYQHLTPGGPIPIAVITKTSTPRPASIPPTPHRRRTRLAQIARPYILRDYGGGHADAAKPRRRRGGWRWNILTRRAGWWTDLEIRPGRGGGPCEAWGGSGLAMLRYRSRHLHHAASRSRSPSPFGADFTLPDSTRDEADAGVAGPPRIVDAGRLGFASWSTG